MTVRRAVAGKVVMAAAAVTGMTVLVAQGQITPPTSPQTFRTSADVVMVDVAVMRDNKPVAGLTAADFQIKDNGVLQKIESVEATAVPIDVTMVLDVSGMAFSRLPTKSQTEKATAQLNADVSRIAAGLRPIDRVRVLAADTYVHQVVPLSPATAVPPVRQLATGGLSSNYDAILAAVLQPVDPARRHVVIASVKVFDTMSSVEAATVRDVASRSDALLHIVLMQTSSGQATVREDFQCEMAGVCEPVARSWTPHDWLLIDPLDRKVDDVQLVPQLRPDGLALQAGAVATGGALHQGQMFSAPTLAATLAKAFDGFRSSYVLRFTPQGVKREGWHTLSVTVANARGARVRARNGYAVESEGDARLAATAVAAAASPPAKPGAPTAPPRTPEEFAAAYDRGDRNAIRAGLQGTADLTRLFQSIREAGNPWPGSAGREAAYVLELADVALGFPGLSGMMASREAVRVIDRFTRLARHPIEPDAFERAWLWAAVCLTEGRFLKVSPIAVAERALERFPNEPRFLLAIGIATDQLWRTHGAIGSAATVRAASTEVTEVHVFKVTAYYRAAMKFSETSAEAHVRLGWLQHRIGRHEDAIATWDASPDAPKDSALVFLRHLFKGHALVALDRLADAVVEYRAATRAVPGAQSARVALMSALAATGDSPAAQAVGQEIEGSPAVGDPWWNFWLGDYRWYAQAVETLRGFSPRR